MLQQQCPSAQKGKEQGWQEMAQHGSSARQAIPKELGPKAQPYPPKCCGAPLTPFFSAINKQESWRRASVAIQTDQPKPTPTKGAGKC